MLRLTRLSKQKHKVSLVAYPLVSLLALLHVGLWGRLSVSNVDFTFTAFYSPLRNLSSPEVWVLSRFRSCILSLAGALFGVAVAC